MQVRGMSWIVLAAGLSLGAAGLEPPLVEAVKQADVEAVRALLTQHPDVDDVNAAEADGTTALHWAVRLDDRNTVDLLIRAGGRVHVANRYGVTPLMLACINGNAAVIEMLLNAGADPNSAYPEGATVLMTAAATGTVDAVTVLLERGADVNARERGHGQTALMWATAENNALAVEALIEAGADIDARSNAGFTPLLLAARAGYGETVGVLLTAGAAVDQTLPDGSTPLILAIINAHYELAAWLLDTGADPNGATQGFTALHQVVWTRRPNRGHAQPPPVQTGNLDSLGLVRQLLASGADLNARVTREPRTTGLSSLKRIGATPFLLAAKSCDLELMQLLVEHGADPLVPTADGTTPLMVAAGVGMFAKGEDPGTNEEALEAVKLALELGGHVTAIDQNGETALHGAAFRGSNTLVQFLFDHGAPLYVTNARGWTPLVIADGVWHISSFKREPQTAVLLRELMSRAESGATQRQ